MLVPLAPSQRRADDPAASRPHRRRAARWATGVLLIAGALLAIGTPALAATHPQPTQTQATHPAQLTSMLAPSAPGGICQVPGIGDIGGLVGLCSAGSSGIVGDLNNICEPSLPQPEQATGGINAMVEPPSSAAGGKTLYDNYGVAGQFWAAHGLQCSDMTSLIGNNVAGMVFDAAKSIDRVTITVYQSAAGNNILNWLQDTVDRLITALGNAIYFPYLAPVVILGAIWLAWQGLIRKRATRTIEGTLWMVVAATAAIALIGRPADFTGIGTAVSNGTTQVLNTAFSKLPAPASSNCLPVAQGDPQSMQASYAFTNGNGLVDENANELWSVLVCKPWLYGELGSTQYAPLGSGTQTVVDTYGRQLLWSQAIAANETPTTALIQAKQATYTGIASSLQQNEPGIYPLFQGNQWTTRLEIAFAAMFAALVAGLLILLIALTLIVLKLGFLLLLVAGPFFLIIGTHPGFGRIIAIRWFEMLVGVLLKQVAIAIVLSVLLYCYSLIMGTADTVLPWALKILMIALVTVAVFIYRRPFTHLFSAVGYGTLGSAERADDNLREAGFTFRRNTVDAASVAVPGVAGYPGGPLGAAQPGPGHRGRGRHRRRRRRGRGRRGRRVGRGRRGGRHRDGAGAAGDAYPSRLRPDAPPVADGDGQTSPAASRGVAAAGPGPGQDRPRNRHRHRPHPTAPGPATQKRHLGTGTASSGTAATARPAAARPAPPPPGPAERGARRPRPGPHRHGPARRPAVRPGPRPPGQRPARTGQPVPAPAAGRPPVRPPRPGRCPAGQAVARPRARDSGHRPGPGRRSTGLLSRPPSHRAVPPPEPAAGPKNLGPCRSGCARYGASNRQAPWSSAPASAAWPSPPSSSRSPRSATTWWSRP